jgi:hypothetical protein
MNVGGRIRTLVAVSAVVGLVVLAVPQGANAAGVRACLENDSYSFTPPLPAVPDVFEPGTGHLGFTSPLCASVIVNEGGEILSIPQPGPGPSGGFDFEYFGGCALALLDGAEPGLEVRVIVGGVVQVAATNQGGGVHAKVGVLVPDNPCPIASAEGPALSVFAP